MPEIDKIVHRLMHPNLELVPRYLDAGGPGKSAGAPAQALVTVSRRTDRDSKLCLAELIAAARPLHALEGLGPILAQNIVDWFADAHHQKVLTKMFEAGVNMRAEEKTVAGTSLAGKTFVLTGTMSVPRDDIKALVEANGGKVTGSVSKKTSYVVAGDSPGSKVDKALKNNVSVISEDDLRALIAE